MAREPVYAAIDIGTSKIIAVVARIGPEGELRPMGTGLAPSLGVQQGVIDDLGEAKEAVRDSLGECLRYMGRNPVSDFFAVVNGDHLIGSNAREMLEAGDEMLTVTEHHLRSLIAGASGMARQQLDTRNEQVLHIIPLRYRVSGMAGVRNPTGLNTSELHLEAHVVRGQTALLADTAQALQASKMRVEGMVAHPLASGEGVLTADEREMGVVMVDIGAGTIKVAAYRDGTPFFSSVLPVGGNQLTRDLAVALRVPYQAADEIKIQHGHVLPDELSPTDEVVMPATQSQPKRVVRRRELCEPLYLRALQMLKLIYEELSRAEIETMPPGGVVLTGGGARMPGFAEMTARGLRTKVRIGTPLWYAGLPDTLRQPEYAATLGALQWAMKHRNRPETGGRIRGEGDRKWSAGSLLRRPFARAGAARNQSQPAESE